MIDNNLLHEHSLFLGRCFRVQRNLFNYLWNRKTLTFVANLREDQQILGILSLKTYASQSVKKKKKRRVNPDASFCEKIKKGVPYCHPKAVGPKPKRGKFGPFRVSFGTAKVPNWLLDTECSFMFGCCLDSSSKVFWQVLAPRHVFILHLWFFISFLNNSSFFRNNYLIDKYPKINLDKV